MILLGLGSLLLILQLSTFTEFRSAPPYVIHSLPDQRVQLFAQPADLFYVVAFNQATYQS